MSDETNMSACELEGRLNARLTEVHDITFPELTLIWNTVADDFIDRSKQKMSMDRRVLQ